MNYPQIKPYLNLAVGKFKTNFLSKEPCPTLFEKEKNLNELFNTIGKAIVKLFSLEGRELMEACYRLGELHYRMRIPFSRLFAGFNFIKLNLYSLLAEDDKLDPLFEKIESKFLKITDFIAKGYTDLILKEFTDYFSSLDVKDRIILYHKEWLEELLRSAKEQKPFEFERCRLGEWMESDEFSLMCVSNPDLCRRIGKTHSSLHRDAKAFYQLFTGENFFEALLVFKTLVMLSYRLTGDLQTLFTKFGSGKEKNLFKFAEKLSGKERFLIAKFNPKNLKMVNRVYGNEAGDRILETVEEVVKETLKGTPSISVRGNSGEIITLIKSADRERVINDIMKAKWRIESKEIEPIGIFPKLNVVGVEVAGRMTSETVRDLLNYAYKESKKLEDELFFLFEGDITDRLLSRIEDEKRKVESISVAVKHKRVDVFFQPIVNLRTGNTSHYEVLARIKEKGKLLPAGAFIDLIYSLDLVVDLDSAVLERILFYAPKLRGKVKKLFINVSPKSIRSRGFIGRLKLFLEAMKDFNIETAFELTEQEFLENMDTVSYISELLGIKFAVDDFGTGYSSIKSVIDLSSKGVISHIKVDGSLVRGINESESTHRIVSVIVAMAKALKLKTVAEFVENGDIAETVKSMGIDFGQGYYFSKPVPADEV